jgi:hypothetical protein
MAKLYEIFTEFLPQFILLSIIIIQVTESIGKKSPCFQSVLGGVNVGGMVDMDGY